jgi:hypothetical protein
MSTKATMYLNVMAFQNILQNYNKYNNHFINILNHNHEKTN